MANFQVRMDQKVFNEVIYNVTYFQLPDASPATLQEFADEIRARFATRVGAIMSDNWSLDSLTMRQMDGGGAFTFTQPFTSGVLEGTEGTGVLPLFNALLVSTGYIGSRPNRGRLYFGGLTEASNNTQGEWNGVDATAYQDLVQDMVDGITTTAGSAFLRIARPDFPANIWTLNNPIDTVIGRQETATMRSRRPS